MKLDEVNRELYQARENEKKVKRANSRLKSDLRKERQETENLRERLKRAEGRKQHYKNGKRGTRLNG